MGVSHLDRIVAKLRDAGAKSDHPAAVVERATLPEQRTLRGTLETIAEVARKASVTAPALLIIGDVTTFMTGATAGAVTGVPTLDLPQNSDARKDGSMSHGAFV
jgi:siroheme synthase